MTPAPAFAISRPSAWASSYARSPGFTVLLPKTAISGRDGSPWAGAELKLKEASMEAGILPRASCLHHPRNHGPGFLAIGVVGRAKVFVEAPFFDPDLARERHDEQRDADQRTDL